MKRTLRSDTIKIIAIVCMFLDHLATVILQRISLTTANVNLALKLNDVSEILIAIGRVAMPLFAYQLAVGMIHTSDKRKYIGRLALFALISEIPFDLAIHGELFYWKYQNVMITLLFGLLAVWLIEWGEKLLADEGRAKRAIFNTAVVTAISIIVEYIKTDYGAKAVILIVMFYIMKKRISGEPVKAGGPAQSVSVSEAATMGMLPAEVMGLVAVLFMAEVFFITYLRTKSMPATMNYCNTEAYALLAFPIVYLDNGVRKGGKFLKWLGYCFYPLHLFLLYLVSMAIL